MQDDGSWLAQIPANTGALHTAKLYGKIIDSRVYWEMYLSKEGFYEDFLWYTGESDLLATEGTWTLRKGPDDDVDWIVSNGPVRRPLRRGSPVAV